MDLVGAGFKPALRRPSAFLVTPRHAVVAPNQVHEVAIFGDPCAGAGGFETRPYPFCRSSCNSGEFKRFGSLVWRPPRIRVAFSRSVGVPAGRRCSGVCAVSGAEPRGASAGGWQGGEG